VGTLLHWFWLPIILQVIEIESEPGPYEIQYDEEWLAITRKFNSIFPLTFKNANFGCVLHINSLYYDLA
jgi:hypothetical protein